MTDRRIRSRAQRRSRNEARARGRLKLAGLVATALAAAALVLAPSALGTTGTTFFGYHLPYGVCCGGDPLHGTHADISTPDTDITGLKSDECVAFWSNSDGYRLDDGSERQIGAGFVDCNNAPLDGNCGKVDPQVEFFWILDAGGENCYPQGPLLQSQDILYGVRQDTNTSTWYAWINGNKMQTHNVAFGGYYKIREGGFYLNDGCSSSNLNVPSVYFALSTVWQRLDVNWSWHTVASANSSGNVCGFVIHDSPPGFFWFTR